MSTAAENGDWLAAELLPHMGEYAAHGIRWYLSRPPIIGLDFEMDLRGYRPVLALGHRFKRRLAGLW